MFPKALNFLLALMPFPLTLYVERGTTSLPCFSCPRRKVLGRH